MRFVFVFSEPVSEPKMACVRIFPIPTFFAILQFLKISEKIGIPFLEFSTMRKYKFFLDMMISNGWAQTNRHRSKPRFS